MNVQTIQMYAEKIGVAILMTTSQGKFVTGIPFTYPAFPLFMQQHSFFCNVVKKFENKLQHLESVALLELDNEYEGIQLMVSPVRQCGKLSHLLWSGPVIEDIEQLKKLAANSTEAPVVDSAAFSIIGQEKKLEIQTALSVLAELWSMKLSMAKQIENSNEFLAFIEHFIHVKLTSETMIDSIGDLIVRGFDVHMFGYAKKNEQGLYQIVTAKGIDENLWKEKRFIEGEGFLGQTVFTKEFIYWEQIKRDPRNKFFQEMGVTPESLISFPVLIDGEIDGVMFAGYMSGQQIPGTEHCWKLVSNLINIKLTEYVIQDQLQRKMMESTVFVELTERMENIKHIREASNLHIDMMYTVTGPVQCCILFAESLVSRGMTKDEEETLRSRVDSEFFKQPFKIYSQAVINNSSIVMPLYNGGMVTTVLVIQCKNNDQLYQYKTFIQSYTKLWWRLSRSHLLSNGYEKAIKLIQAMMKEWNEEQYEKTLHASTLADAFVKKLSLDPQEMQQVKAVSKVIGCRIELLEKALADTPLINLVYEYQALLKGEGHSSYSRAAQITALIDRYVQKKDVNQLVYVENSLRDSFLTLAAELHYQIGYKEKTPVIEEITDIQTTIASLPISPREQEVLFLILEGLNNQEIAERLFISIHTVKNHLTKVFSKLGVADRNQAMAMIYRIKFK